MTSTDAPWRVTYAPDRPPPNYPPPPRPDFGPPKRPVAPAWTPAPGSYAAPPPPAVPRKQAVYPPRDPFTVAYGVPLEVPARRGDPYVSLSGPLCTGDINYDPPPEAAGTGLMSSLPDGSIAVAPLSVIHRGSTVGDEGPINEAFLSSPVIRLSAGRPYALSSPVIVPDGATLYLNRAAIDRELIQPGENAQVIDLFPDKIAYNGGTMSSPTEVTYAGPVRAPDRRVPASPGDPWTPTGIPPAERRGLSWPLIQPPAVPSRYDLEAIAPALAQGQNDHAAVIAPLSSMVPADQLIADGHGDELAINAAYEKTPVVKLTAGAPYLLLHDVHVPDHGRLYLNRAMLDRRRIQLGRHAVVVDDPDRTGPFVGVLDDPGQLPEHGHPGQMAVIGTDIWTWSNAPVAPWNADRYQSGIANAVADNTVTLSAVPGERDRMLWVCMTYNDDTTTIESVSDDAGNSYHVLATQNSGNGNWVLTIFEADQPRHPLEVGQTFTARLSNPAAMRILPMILPLAADPEIPGIVSGNQPAQATLPVTVAQTSVVLGLFFQFTQNTPPPGLSGSLNLPLRTVGVGTFQGPGGSGAGRDFAAGWASSDAFGAPSFDVTAFITMPAAQNWMLTAIIATPLWGWQKTGTLTSVPPPPAGLSVAQPATGNVGAVAAGSSWSSGVPVFLLNGAAVVRFSAALNNPLVFTTGPMLISLTLVIDDGSPVTLAVASGAAALNTVLSGWYLVSLPAGYHTCYFSVVNDASSAAAIPTGNTLRYAFQQM